MEDKTVKTIDFLRARLLAERSVSRTARQRAYELSKRVSELEKQLKYVSLQRKKAEKATVDVLLILENHGRNDLSEQFNSSSDQDEISSQHAETETSTQLQHVKSKPQESEFSSSEVESSRSLSWKSSKNSSSRFLEKKYTEASRRRRSNSFTSTGSSPRRVGKSCRQIRHREHRSPNDDVAQKNDGSEKDMERALERQAQFIARYEAEEKAQREWEDKFRENDWCDPGTHSDVTEERDEIKGAAPPVIPSPCCNDKTTPGSGSEEIDAKLSEEPNIKIETEDPKNSDVVNNVNVSDNQIQNHPQSTQFIPGHVSSSQNSSLLDKGEETSGNKSYETNVGTHENPGELGSVLEALQQAKLSLRSLEKVPLLQNGPSVPAYRSMEKFPVPFSSVGLFRLPIDYEYGAGVNNNNNNLLTYDSRLSLTSQQHTGPSGGQFGQFVTESLSSSSGSLDDRFRMVPTFPYQETGLPALDPRFGVGPPARDPRLDVGFGLSARDPRFDVGARDPRLDAGFGQAARDSRLEIGPTFQARSLYGDYIRPNMYK